MANTEIHETIIGGWKVLEYGRSDYGIWAKVRARQDPDGVTFYLEFPSLVDLERSATALDQLVQALVDEEREVEQERQRPASTGTGLGVATSTGGG